MRVRRRVIRKVYTYVDWFDVVWLYEFDSIELTLSLVDVELVKASVWECLRIEKQETRQEETYKEYDKDKNKGMRGIYVNRNKV